MNGSQDHYVILSSKPNNSNHSFSSQQQQQQEQDTLQLHQHHQSHQQQQNGGEENSYTAHFQPENNNDKHHQHHHHHHQQQVQQQPDTSNLATHQNLSICDGRGPEIRVKAENDDPEDTQKQLAADSSRPMMPVELSLVPLQTAQENQVAAACTAQTTTCSTKSEDRRLVVEQQPPSLSCSGGASGGNNNNTTNNNNNNTNCNININSSACHMGASHVGPPGPHGDSTQVERRYRPQKYCAVCGDKAIACNFNAVTCESCKAFFRRNAFKEQRLKCLFDNRCIIDRVTRRFCSKCRLLKCLQIGMKREWILTDEQKHIKRVKIMQNKQSRQMVGQAVGPQSPSTLQHQLDERLAGDQRQPNSPLADSVASSHRSMSQTRSMVETKDATTSCPDEFDLAAGSPGGAPHLVHYCSLASQCQYCSLRLTGCGVGLVTSQQQQPLAATNQPEYHHHNQQQQQQPQMLQQHPSSVTAQALDAPLRDPYSQPPAATNCAQAGPPAGGAPPLPGSHLQAGALYNHPGEGTQMRQDAGQQQQQQQQQLIQANMIEQQRAGGGQPPPPPVTGATFCCLEPQANYQQHHHQSPVAQPFDHTVGQQ